MADDKNMNSNDNIADRMHPHASAEALPHSDPALEPANEHHHAHRHHTAFAEQGREDEVVYSKDTTFEKPTIPDHGPSPEKNEGKGDIEEVGASVAKRPWHRRLLKHWRHVAHAVIWLLFTG